MSQSFFAYHLPRISAMWVRVVLPICLLIGLAGIALWFQQELTHERRQEIERSFAPPDPNTLVLEIGGDFPRLPVRRAPVEKRAPVEPQPPKQKQERKQKPEPRYTELRKGETIYGVCKRIFGSARRFREILAHNHLTEEGARRLPPGTRVFLPE